MQLKETPLQLFEVNGRDVWVKREDLCWPFPALSKARGVYRAVERRPGKNLAVVDTGRSLNGQLVATIGLSFGRQVKCGYPRYVDRPNEIPGPALAIRSLGVELVPLQANRQFVMRSQMQQLLDDSWYLFPTGLRLPETVEAVEEQMHKVYRGLGRIGTVIVPTGTGTHLAGIMRALDRIAQGYIVAVQGYARKEERFRRDVDRMAGVNFPSSDWRVVTSMCDYFEVRPDKLPPFAANMHYEVRAWKWLTTPGCIETLRGPIVFWNIGA
jgi:1-aminocyclopropane-1-carboxylate deaminase/D-cysteine desulfhydrase-like pyridoxal-dependent ACC family enzyme